jgi:hypothetical protein
MNYIGDQVDTGLEDKSETNDRLFTITKIFEP